jgi:hypothetical protein
VKSKETYNLVHLLVCLYISSSTFRLTAILRHQTRTQNWPKSTVSSVVLTYAALSCRTTVKSWQACSLQLHGTRLLNGLSSCRTLQPAARLLGSNGRNFIEFLTLEDITPIGCPEASITKHQHTPRYFPERQRPHLHHDRSPKFQLLYLEYQIYSLAPV